MDAFFWVCEQRPDFPEKLKCKIFVRLDIFYMFSHLIIEGTATKEDFDKTSESFFFGSILQLSNYNAFVFTIVLSTITGAYGLSKFWKFYILRGHSMASWGYILTFGICCLYCFRGAIGINLTVLASFYTGFAAFVSLRRYVNDVIKNH